jgi:hypothetical protein
MGKPEIDRDRQELVLVAAVRVDRVDGVVDQWVVAAEHDLAVATGRARSRGHRYKHAHEHRQRCEPAQPDLREKSVRRESSS